MAGDRLHWQKSFSFTLFRASGPGIHARCQHAGQAVRGAWYGGRDPSRAPGHLFRRGAARGLRLLAAQRTHGAQWQSPFRWARGDPHNAPRIGVHARRGYRLAKRAGAAAARGTHRILAGRQSAERRAAGSSSQGVTDSGPVHCAARGWERADASAPSGIDAAPPTTVTRTLHPPRRPFKIAHSGRRGPGTIRRALWL